MEIENKFEIGQDVYYLNEDTYPLSVRHGVVESILIEQDKYGNYEYQYNLGGIDFIEESRICSAESREKAEWIFGLRRSF